MKDYLTDFEKKKRERNRQIVSDFRELNPVLMEKGYRPYRTVSQLAAKYKLTEAGIRSILKREGIIEKLSNLS